MPQETLLAGASIEGHRGERPDETFESLLDRLGIDLFLGVRVPEVGHPDRPWVSTTAHLEHTPGWISIFRNLNSAVYLRRNERNRENLQKVARHYARLGVPFDVESGFDVTDVVAGAPAWSVARGVVPEGFSRLVHVAQRQPGAGGTASRDRLAALYAVLGVYERAARIDRSRLEEGPDDVRVRRRLVWSLLRLRRFAEAAEAANALAAQPERDGLSRLLARTAHEIAGWETQDADSALANLPFLARPEVPWLMAGVAFPAPRD